MLKNIKAALFDLDGTLIDSMWVWRYVDEEFFAKRNLTMPADLQKNIEGMSMKETAQYFKTNFALTDSIEELMMQWNDMAFETYATKVEFKPGALEFLKYLKNHGIKTAICTSNSRELLDVVIKKMSLDSYIDYFITANEVKHGKPSPDIYEKAAKSLGVNCHDCLVFEDIIPGMQAGLAAGMKVCAIYDDYTKDLIEEKKEIADYYIKDYFEIIDSLEACR